MAWRPVWHTMFGHFPEPDEFLSPLTGSCLYLGITIVSGLVLRLFNKIFIHPNFSEYFADFLATVEMCAYFYENNFIFKHYGPVWLFVAIMIECLIANRTYFGASENPCKALFQYCKKEIGIKKTIVKITVQTLAGLASYKYARFVWSLDMVPDHRERFHETVCNTDLNVALFVGLGIELAATLSDTWLGMQTLLKHSFLDEVIKVGNGALMIVLGISTTGMYFNPAMATGHLYGCKGASHVDHILVYWIGPFIGCVLAVIFDRLLHIDVTAPPKSATASTQDSKKKRQ